MATYREQRHRILMATQGAEWLRQNQWRGEVHRTCPDCEGLGVRASVPCVRCGGMGDLPDPIKPSRSLWRCSGCGEFTSTAKAECRRCYAPRITGESGPPAHP